MLTLQKGFCIHTLRWLWDSEPITLSRLEIGLYYILTVGGEKEFDILVNMHAGLKLTVVGLLPSGEVCRSGINSAESPELVSSGK